MAILIATFLVFSLSFIQNGAAGTCPEKCKSGQVCDDADSGCSDCQDAYWGRQCQHPYECKTTTKGQEYAGYRSTTSSVITCQKWSLDTPHSHPRKTLPENYCRNPDNWLEPWCYTMDPDTRYEGCGIEFCNTHCPVPTLNVFSDITNPPSTGFQVGVMVSIIAVCGPGTSGKRTCKADKTWTDPFDCTVIKWCPKPELKPRSSITDIQEEYNFNTELNVLCDSGYEITGSQSKVKCQEDKSWGTIPSCTPVQCASPVLNENSIIVGGKKDKYSYDDTISVGCSNGYTTPKQTTHTCGADKRWSGTLPTCLPVPCQDLNLKQHSSIESGKKSGFGYGDKVKIICDAGYNLKGQGTLDCLANGQWNSQPPTCEPVPCPQPNLSSKTSVVNPKDEYVFKDKIQLECDVGFKIIGSNETTCQADRTWSTIPACTEVKCTKPVIVENGVIIDGEKAEYVYKDSVSVNCSTGYDLQGNNTMTCHHTGNWMGTDWQCVAVECALPSLNSKNAIENPKGTYQYGDTIKVGCASGYTLSGQTSFSCRADRTWSEAMPICKEIEEEGGNVGGAVGGAVGGLVAVGVVIFVVFIVIRRRRQNPAAKYRSNHENDGTDVYVNMRGDSTRSSNAIIKDKDIGVSMKDEESDDENAKNEDDDNVYCNVENDTLKQADTKRRISDLVIEEKDFTLFAAQYAMLKSGLQRNTNEACKPQNRNKNKYKSIYAYDDNRVKLRNVDGKSDYINASPIKDINGKPTFIAAQGPIKTSLNDFWQMIWELKSGKIVMLTNLFEESRKKCEQYWPEEETEQYGDFNVKLCGEEVFADFTIRQLSVTDKTKNNRFITQFHFTAWPDKSVPKYASSLVQFRRKVCATPTREKGPMIVHCSAGIGRTGTFIALNYLVDEFTQTGFVDVYSCVEALRQQRVNMVQTKEQYAFLYSAVVEEYQCQQSTIAASDFVTKFQKLQAVNPKTKVPYIDEEYQHLNIASPMFEDDESMEGKKPVHKQKNRYEDILPVDAYRPWLVGDGDENGSYINAAYLPGYKDNRAYLSTQMPLPGTVIDFWTLIVEQEITSILMLNTAMDKTCGQYWPDDGKTKTFGPYTVSSSETTETSVLLIKEMEVRHKETKLTVKQFRLIDWPEANSVPSSPSLFLEIMDVILAWQIGKPVTPVLIHCLDGARKTGLFCTVMTIIDRLKIEQDVTIPQTVKQIRSRRPQIIVDERQHRYCYEAVCSYLQGFETYSNYI